MKVKLTKIGVTFPSLTQLVSENWKEVQHTIGERAFLYCYELEEEHGLVLHIQDFTDMENGTYDLPVSIHMFMEAASLNAGGYVE